PWSRRERARGLPRRDSRSGRVSSSVGRAAWRGRSGRGETTPPPAETPGRFYLRRRGTSRAPSRGRREGRACPQRGKAPGLPCRRPRRHSRARLNHLRVGLLRFNIRVNKNADKDACHQAQKGDQDRNAFHLPSGGARKVIGIVSPPATMRKWVTSSLPRGAEISNSPVADAPGWSETGPIDSDAPGRSGVENSTVAGVLPRLASV